MLLVAIINCSSLTRVPEGSHQEEIRGEYPLYLVIIVKHLALIVGVHDPMIRAEVERGCVSNLLMISHLNFGSVGPVFDDWAQIDVVVYSIVMELFLLNLIDRVSEHSIYPMENIKHSNTHNNKFVVWYPTSHNVHSEQTLQLHNILMQQCGWECSQKLYNEVVL